MLLPITEKITDGDDAIVGTLSNSASTSKLPKINATTVGNIFALLPAEAVAGSLPQGPDFLHNNVPVLEEYFLEDGANIGTFKFIKLPTIFLLPNRTTAINGSLSNNSISNAFHNISVTTGPLWSKLLLTWSKPFTDTILHNPIAVTLLPPLKKDQLWSNNALIQSEGLTTEKEEDWATIKAIHDARNHHLATNNATPNASLVVVSTMANNQSVLTADSTQNKPTPVKKSPHCPPTASQADTC